MTRYVTDDPYSNEVIIQFAVERKLMTVTDVDGKLVYDFINNSEDSADKIIELGIKLGYLKVHLELDEWYYHPTSKGISILKCTCCNKERFEDDECKDPPLLNKP